MGPAQQRLDSADLAAAQVDLRLPRKRQLGPRERRAQVGFELDAALHLEVHGLVIEHALPAPRHFGPAHREIGVAHQPVSGAAIGRKHADAHRRPQLVRLRMDHERVAHRLQQLFGDARGVAGRIDGRQQDHELVAAETRHHVLVAHAVADAAAGLLQRRVAARQARRVVDMLELVEVDEQQREAAGFAQRAADFLGQPVLQIAPVGQGRDFIVVRLQVQLLIACRGGERHAQAVRDIACHQLRGRGNGR